MASAFDYLPIILASQQAQAAREQAARQEALQQQQFDYFKTQNEQDRAAAAPILQSVKDTLTANAANAAADRKRYEDVYQPIENQLVSDANSYASPERKLLEIGKATSLVSNQMEGQRQSAIRNLEGFGIDPSATRYAGLDANMRAFTGAAQASAGNAASQNVDNTARALRSEALNIGRGYPGQIAQAYGTGLNASSMGMNGILGLTGSAAQTTGTPTQYGALSNQSMSNATSALGLMNQGYQNYYANQHAQNTGSGWGSLLGLAGGSLLGGQFGGRMGSALGGWLTGGGATARAAEGGAIPASTSPTAGAAIDDVPARLTVGEFVIPKDAVQWFGEKHFQNLIQKARAEKEQAAAKPEIGVEPQVPPTFVSRPQGGALPVG